LLVGCDGGVYETWDFAGSWDFKSNLPVTQFYKVSTDNASPFYHVHGGTQDNLSLGGPSRLVSEIEALGRTITSSNVQLVIAARDAEPRDNESWRRAVSELASWNDDPTRPLLAWEELAESPSPASHLTIPPLLQSVFVSATPRACCLGVVAVGTEATLPTMEGTKANSFNFVRTGTTVPWTREADECTAYRRTGDGGQGADRAELQRHLWLVEDDRLVLHSTDTGDFSVGEIAHIKDGMSHLFVDRSPAGVLDDFTEGMRRVLPDSTCDACANRTRCSRRFQVVEGPPFAREEAWIADYITRLRGRVLDVGCGEQLYRNELAPLVRSGVVRYTGLDPDEASLTPLREVLPDGVFYVGGIEDFRGEPESYDRILCLRSLNHVFSLDEALARMTQLLRPGGQLLIVETTPFAMLREAEQVAAADRAPRAGHQHFRNAYSQDVLPFARRRSLRVVEHHRASLQTSNEWILLLERARG
jgi:SAM-dependent methyltransferase